MRKSREARKPFPRGVELIYFIAKEQYHALLFRRHYSKQICTTCPLGFPSIHHLCRKCRSLKLGHYFRCQATPLDNEGPLADIEFPFGQVKDIVRRKKCGLCSAVDQAIQSCVRQQYRDILPQARIELCFRNYHTALIVIEVHLIRVRETILEAHPMIFGHTPDHSSRENPKEVLPTEIQPFVRWDMVRSWMDCCDRIHESCSTHGSLIALPPRMLLVDVEGQNLVDAPHHVTYIALSYVWGSDQAAALASCKRATVDSLRQTGSLSSLRLPVVIADAMQICRKLGERYLWVDWLCILQDDEEFKQEQIDSMAAIYQKATLVIIAANARSMDDHIAGVGAARNPVDFACAVGDLFVANILWGLHNAVHATFWRTRGWTYQEAVCAKRRLFLTENQAYYECGIDTRSENLTPFFLPNLDIPHQYRLDSRLGEAAPVVGGNADAFHSYASHLRNYMSRDLTFSSDVFSGFLGVSRAIYGKDETFFHGLPQSHFSEALLWVSGQENGKLAKARRVANLRVPSWTWASATCSVKHLVSGGRFRRNMFAGPLCAWIVIEWSSITPKLKAIELYQDSHEWKLKHDAVITESESTQNIDQRTGTSYPFGYALSSSHPRCFNAIEHYVTQAWNAGCFEETYPSRDNFRTCDLVARWPTYYEFWQTAVAAEVYRAIISPRLVVPADATLYTRAQSAFSNSVNTHAVGLDGRWCATSCGPLRCWMITRKLLASSRWAILIS